MPEKISFSLLQLQAGVTPFTAPNSLDSTNVGTTTSVVNRAFVAIIGDGDKLLEIGETGFVLSGMASGNQVASATTLNTTADPVTITTHGRMNAGAVGQLATDGALSMINASGMGVDNGVELSGRYLNGGDSITWTLNDKGGLPQQLIALSFVVDMNGGIGPTEVTFDFDGNVLGSGSYAAAQNGANVDALLRLSVNGGSTISIDFLTHTLLVNGVARTGAAIDQFFAAHDLSPQGTVTIGNVTGAGFAVRDLVLDRTDYAGSAANLAPTLTLANMVTDLAGNTPITAPLKVADIVIGDDGVGLNQLTLSGADAGLFQITGNALYLKAGTVLDVLANPTLDVSVTVDDHAIGAGSEATAGLAVQVAANTDNRISFSVVQFAPGMTPAASANLIGASNLGATTALVNRGFVAIMGDGDKLLEGGETGYVLSGFGSANHVVNAGSLNTVLDAVTISTHGRMNAGAVGQLATDGALTMANAMGMAVDSGVETSGRYLNGGDSITWTLNDRGGMPQKLTAFSFVVDMNGGTGLTEVAFDFDGDVIRTGAYAAGQNGANADVALRLSVNGGSTITIDFVAHTLLVNGVARTGVLIDQFFATHELSPQGALTIGNLTGAGFSVRDLILDRADTPVNLAPTISLSGLMAGIPENTPLPLHVKVADINITDDGIGPNLVTLSGANAALFEVVGSELFLKSGVVLDYETIQHLDVTVTVDDPTLGTGPEGSVTYSLNVTNVNEAPTLTLTGLLAGIAENTVLPTSLKVADIDITDDALGTHPITLTGADAALFEVVGTGLYLKAGVVLNYETLSHLDVTLSVNDPNIGTGPEASVNFSLNVTDVNEAPTLALSGTLTTLADNANLTLPVMVADFVVTDDALGTNTMSLIGADAAFFEISGNSVFLRAGVGLDFMNNRVLDVSVVVDDASIGAGPEVVSPISIALTHTVGTIAIDGQLSDWAANTRLDTAANGVPGYEVRGTYQGDSFVMSLKTDGTAIGPNTTLWLNTDLNNASGFQVFGGTVGAEYNINFDANGHAALYSGGAGEILVSANLNYVLSADGTTLELELPSNLMAGAPRQVEMYLDINNAPFIPTNYSAPGFRFGEKPPLLPMDPGTRIAIVYSETSAGFYFDRTAYGQMFMAAQNQAMQAGIPFDIITEADLTNIATLVKYDALVFPGLSHVQSGDLAAITATLTTAVEDYGIGMIAMGNFLTNDQTGAAFAGDSYARMKAILGVTLGGFGTTAGVDLNAVNGSHPVSDQYGTNELVGHYNSTSYQNFIDVTGSGQVVFTQTVDGPTTPPEVLAAVIATLNDAGRAAHFATDAVFGNNNILAEAINWAARGDAPDVGLQMTRGTSLFYSRNDMDQSQEVFDVSDSNPGIYDAMLPIVQQWYQDYGFVGSYYINVGADAPDQVTDWAISRPYYDLLLAMGNEIGTHSYTHPANTNLLLPTTFTETQRQAWLTSLSPGALKTQLQNLTLAQTQDRLTAALTLTDPRNPLAVNPATLGDLDREILKASFQFQFEYSKLIIERELGITIDGGAVPGAPEQVGTTVAIMQYLGYLSGGYSGVGAGYPGAFGFLDPAHLNQVYFAPNVTFDFSLIGFQHLTAAQAEVVWAAEYARIMGHGTTPIIHLPWHDYGPTNWPDGSGQNPGYTLQMYTNFIARAAADGTEFVTGADLAQRIETFAATEIEIRTVGQNVIATVTGTGVGKFALDVESTQVIASVANWYAYDSDQVFLPRNGGTFEISFGAVATDVTHITSLPMRTELVSATGNGTNLAFAVIGQGLVTVDLKAWGAQSVVASGADSGALTGEVLSLSFAALGPHLAAITYSGAAAVDGTAAHDFIIGSTGNTRIDGLQGNDMLTGGAGSDVFVFHQGGGIDTVRDFVGALDFVELANSGFASAAAALGAFVATAEGLVLNYAGGHQLVLAGLTLGQLAVDHIILSNDPLV